MTKLQPEGNLTQKETLNNNTNKNEFELAKEQIYSRLLEFGKRFDIPGKLKDGIISQKELKQLSAEYEKFTLEYEKQTGKKFQKNEFVTTFFSLGKDQINKLLVELGLPDEKSFYKIKIELSDGKLVSVKERMNNIIGNLFEKEIKGTRQKLTKVFR